MSLRLQSQYKAEAFKIKLAQISDVDIAWFAGWLCADGCITSASKSKKYPTIYFGISDRDVLERFIQLFGGSIATLGRRKSVVRPGVYHKPMYGWGVYSMKAVYLLERCMPWLSLRYRERAALAMQFKQNVRISPADVKIIRAALADGVQGKELAERYGVFESTISRIKHGVNWDNVLWLDAIIERMHAPGYFDDPNNFPPDELVNLQ